ncbi:hypothetical protein Tco_1417581 [Tanacetum coccineum]
MDDEFSTLDFIKQLLLDDIEIPSSSSQSPDPLLDIDLSDCFLSDFDTLDYWSPSNVSCSPSDSSSSETSFFDTTSGFFISAIADLLSTCIVIFSSCDCVSLPNSLFSHNACVATAVAAMNSDSHDDSAIVACFCVLQLIGDSPMLLCVWSNCDGEFMTLVESWSP